nr:MMS19 nucleotide excision repair protein homolog isoform X2 [Tanacetum cinerariifolium]
MVQKIKVRNEPLSRQIMTLEESIKSSKEKLVEMKQQLVETREKLEKIISECDSVADARNNNARELRHANLETVNLVLIGTSSVVKSNSPVTRPMLHRPLAHVITNTPLSAIMGEANKVGILIDKNSEASVKSFWVY